MSTNGTSDKHSNSNYTGVSGLTAESCRELINSFQFYQTARKTNIYISLVIILVGCVGNSLGVLVFAQKRFRIHPSTIYFLFICLSDGLFLLTHYFEDIIRTYIDIYKHEDDLRVYSSIHRIPFDCWSLVDPVMTERFASPDNIKLHQVLISFFNHINITDSFSLCCQVVNYLRNFLRFLSAYLIVAFTVQRMFAIRFPFQAQSFESNRLAWRISLLLAILGSLLNIWVPFWFQIQTEDRYCDVSRDKSTAYFYVTCLYILLTMLIPILVIFVCNTIILCQIVGSNHRRDLAGVQNILIAASPNQANGSESHSVGGSASVPLNQANKRARSSSFRGTIVKHWSNENFKITRMLMFMSLSYAILNLPYFIAWSLFFYQIGIKKAVISHAMRYEMFAVMQICEIFYVLNYACHFFIYSASGKRFRQQLRQAFCKRATGI